MKLKNYLILTHLLILLISTSSIAILYDISNNYNTRTGMKDYLAAKVELAKYEALVNDPELYLNKEGPIYIEEVDSNKDVAVILYDANGRTIYSTFNGSKQMLTREELYRNLNDIQHSYSGDIIKRPVFQKNQLVGFYKIIISRENVASIVKCNLKVSVVCFIVINVLILIWVIRRIDTCFDRPLKAVINSMNDYAKGNNEVHIDYKATDEIGKLCAHFNEMKDEIEHSKNIVAEEQKAKEYMIATISHDLKTPLTAIRAYTEMFKLGEVDREKAGEYIDTILNKCDYMKDMLDDLLTYNLLTMDYELNLVEVEGDEFCEMLFSGIEGMCEQKHIKLHQEIKVEGNYLVDARYMPRVIDNIVSNAIRHTEPGRWIWMGAFSTDAELPTWISKDVKKRLKQFQEPSLWIIIKNEGIPINEEDKENLFRPFYQGDEARSKKEHKGVGLGLSISKMIMEKHGGSIEVIPEVESGNFIVCYLNKYIIMTTKGKSNKLLSEG